MRAVGDKQRGTIRQDFDISISLNFQGSPHVRYFQGGMETKG